MRRISLGWIAVTFILAVGGLSLAGALAAVASVEGEWFGRGALFLGALFGGFIGARTSPASRRIEPLVGGILLAAALMATVWVVSSGALVPASLQVELSFKVGLLAGLGAVVGALIGQKLGRPARPDSQLRWLGLSALIHLGVFAILGILLLLANIDLDVDSGASAAAVVAFFPMVLVAGFVTQAAAPKEMFGICGAGGALGLVALSLAGAVVQGDWLRLPLVALGAVLGGLVLTLFGALGARIGWAVAERFGRPEPEGELPSARAR